ALNNHQFTSVIILLFIALGVASFFSMPRSEDPQFDFPTTITTIVYPGTNPSDLEKLVVDPVESAIKEIDDIKVMRTQIEDGLAVVRTEFLFGSDPDETYDDIVSAVTAISDTLPTEIKQIKHEKVSPADTYIMQIGLTSASASYSELHYWSDKLEQQLERVAGVKRVDIDALPEREIHIRLDLVRMSELGLSIQQVSAAIQSAGQNIPGGHVQSEGRRFTVQTSGDFDSLDQIRQIVIRANDNAALYLQDIATVEVGDELARHEAYYQGQRTVFISVVQRKSTNIFDVSTGLHKIIDQFSSQIDSHIRVDMIFDQSSSVSHRVDGFFENLLQGLLLVGLFTLAILGFRAATVVILAIPLSIFIGIGWLDLAGYGLQQMSIAGLIIALGLLVDNAIVVTENVGRFMREGHTREYSALHGASQVSWAVISGTLTTVLAFFPILLLPSGSGTFMRSMPVTVILTLCASLIIAIALTPLIASRFLKGKSSQSRFTSPVLKGLNYIAAGPYTQLLQFSLRFPKTVMLLALLILIGSLSLFKDIGVSLFPKAEKPIILVNIETAEGTSFDQTRRLAQRISGEIQHHAQVKSSTVNVGKANPRIYYNLANSMEAANFAQILVQLNFEEQDGYQVIEDFVAQTRTEYSAIPGARVTVQEFMQGPPYVAPITIRIVGEELDQLQHIAHDVEKIILATEGTISVDNPVSRHKVDVAIHVNREKAAMMNVDISQLDQTIRANLVGLPVGTYIDSLGEDHTLMLRGDTIGEPKWEIFHNLKVQSRSGHAIPLQHIAEIELVNVIPRFQHYNTERMVQVTSDVKPGFQADALTNEIVQELDQYPWPSGVHYVVGGEQENRKESFSGMTQALLVALMGIFAVLVMQFRSFSQPVIIFAAIPFALTGAILGLWITGYTFSFTAFVGLTSLVGIVVNNSIILVDYANQKRTEFPDMAIADAIADSARTRLLPIVLTTLTTIGGLLPLTLSGSSMWSPMGWAIIGGLTVSTLLTLIVVPVLYIWFTPAQSGNSVRTEPATPEYAALNTQP
ncbi:MAG: efflux RND transporter permease subunit, partial [Pseudomonadales bacterium]|nr:efflux RND transporter permease subunit [Pseudomonadales bacterium]